MSEFSYWPAADAYMLLDLDLAVVFLFYFHDTATTEIYTLSLHDALPISFMRILKVLTVLVLLLSVAYAMPINSSARRSESTRLNSSHVKISYAVFCLKKKNTQRTAHRAAAGIVRTPS